MGGLWEITGPRNSTSASTGIGGRGASCVCVCVCVCVYAHARAGGGRLRKTALGTAKKVFCKDQPLAWETTVLTLLDFLCAAWPVSPSYQ